MPVDVLQAMFEEGHCYPVQLLRGFGYDPRTVIIEIDRQTKKREEKEKELKKKYELPPYLKQFGTNLNRLARMDKLPPLIGREKELSQIMEILSHKERSNSVMLVGEAGVGKTAIVEGLARMVELEPERVPLRLQEKQIVNLQMNTIAEPAPTRLCASSTNSTIFCLSFNSLMIRSIRSSNIPLNIVPATMVFICKFTICFS